ncbi:hypothetical protein VR41_13435 [Streptomyces sp. NRRL B-1568]|nr:hypothetical protein VR41_13435 [Streptomyces sp. NRRL B-1568]
MPGPTRPRSAPPRRRHSHTTTPWGDSAPTPRICPRPRAAPSCAPQGRTVGPQGGRCNPSRSLEPRAL